MQGSKQINKQENKKTSYTECYVAFLDILGFKNLVSKSENNCLEIRDTLKGLEKNIVKAHLGNRESLDFSDVFHYLMSDSIVYYVDSSSPNALVKLIISCSFLVYQMSSKSSPIFLRGAITKGQLFADERVIFGKALVNAYLQEENNAIYPRIICSKALINSADGNNNTHEYSSNFLFDHGFVYEDCDHWCCIENFALLKSIVDNEKTKVLSNLMSYLSNQLDTDIDNSIREKYIYLLDHYDKTSKGSF